MKRFAKRLLRAASNSRIGERILRYLTSSEAVDSWIHHPDIAERIGYALLRSRPQALAEPLFIKQSTEARFEEVQSWPKDLAGFEDLAFLFSSGHLNAGIAILAFDEAAFLYDLTKSLSNANIVEIGRYKGGSTLLLAAALDDNSRLHSYDWFGAPDVRLRKSDGSLRFPAKGSTERDEQLRKALRRYGLEERVQLLIADSRTAPPPREGCDLVFIDGDHTYEGAAADFRNWSPHVRKGGHVLFHDANPRPFSPAAVGVTRLVKEIEAKEHAHFSRQPDVGSIAHFVCTELSSPLQMEDSSAQADWTRQSQEEWVGGNVGR